VTVIIRFFEKPTPVAATPYQPHVGWITTNTDYTSWAATNPLSTLMLQRWTKWRVIKQYNAGGFTTIKARFSPRKLFPDANVNTDLDWTGDCQTSSPWYTSPTNALTYQWGYARPDNGDIGSTEDMAYMISVIFNVTFFDRRNNLDNL